MKTVSQLIITLVTVLMPAFCQTTISQFLNEKQVELLHAGNTVYSAELKLPKYEENGSGSPILPSVASIVPQPSAVEGSLVQPRLHDAKRKMMEWKLSLLALAAAHSADAATSWNKRELNPMLSPSSGAFGLQTLAIKWAITGGSMGLQAILLRRRPQLSKMFAGINCMESGVIGATAIHNSFVPVRQ